MAVDVTTLKLEWLCATKDAQIGQLTIDLAESRAGQLVEAFRKAHKASHEAQWNPQTFSFIEPEPADESVDPAVEVVPCLS